MLKKLISLVVSLGIICSIVVLPAGTAYAADIGNAVGEDGIVHIRTAQDLKNWSDASQTATHWVNSANQTFVLDNDIIIPESYKNQINISPESDGPFRGIFDGKGHTIGNL